MANAHKHRQRVVRGIDDDLAAEFDEAAKRAGSDRSSVTRALWEWFAGRPGAKLPERPAGPEPLQIRYWDDLDRGEPGWQPHWDEWTDLDPDGEIAAEDAKFQVRVKP